MFKKIILTTLFGAGCAFTGAVVFAAMELLVGHEILDALGEGRVKLDDLTRVQAACVMLAMNDENWDAVRGMED